jgi:formyltetrahydrofolate hydrolase
MEKELKKDDKQEIRDMLNESKQDEVWLQRFVQVVREYVK